MASNMTDNEIIKALECCMKICEDCDNCPCINNNDYTNVYDCKEALLKNALDLINRLQAQNKDLAETIHNLTIEKDTLFDKAEELKADNERLKDEIGG